MRIDLYLQRIDELIGHLEPVPKFDRIISLPLWINCGLRLEEGEDKEEEKINILSYS
ncbi:MAG TPA: hypothetical protein VN704_03040 [Verrucomicrobiae bacterium]|nr:hypothetical protein [Verrucomicrobiae bacterium]